MKKSFLAFAASFFIVSSPVLMGAEEGDLHASVRQACQADLEQFCKDITPGEGRESACLKSHDDKISAGCKQEVQSIAKKMDEFMQSMETACAQDIEKFCQDSTSLQNVLTCLKTHTAELSDPCKTFSQNNPQGPT